MSVENFTTTTGPGGTCLFYCGHLIGLFASMAAALAVRDARIAGRWY